MVELLLEPTITMQELDKLSEKVAKDIVEFLIYLLEDELDDLYARHSEMNESLESLLGFSNSVIRMPRFKSKLRELRDTARRAPKGNRPKINEIIRLYEEKRIKNFITAKNGINRLAFKHQTTPG